MRFSVIVAARLGFKKPSESDQLVFVSSGTTRAIEIANAAEKYGFKNVSVLTGMCVIVPNFVIRIMCKVNRFLIRLRRCSCVGKNSKRVELFERLITFRRHKRINIGEHEKGNEIKF